MLTLRNRVIPRVVQQLLGALHRHRALAGDEARQLQPRVERGGLVRVHLADETYRQRLLAGEVPGRQADVLDPRRAAHELGQAAQGAEVGRQPDVDLLDGEARVPYADADVGAA